MRINYKKINREMRMEKTSRAVEFFRKQGYKFELKNYKMLSHVALPLCILLFLSTVYVTPYIIAYFSSYVNYRQIYCVINL